MFALRNEIFALKKEVKELQAPKKHVFKMTDSHKYKAEERPFHSPLFSNQEKGYKMAIRVLSYDHIEGKGTHVSVYVHLMRGLLIAFSVGLSLAPFKLNCSISSVISICLNRSLSLKVMNWYPVELLTMRAQQVDGDLHHSLH